MRTPACQKCVVFRVARSPCSLAEASAGPKGAKVNSQGREPLVVWQDRAGRSNGGDSRFGLRRKESIMPQSFGSLHCHFVFSTKHRQPQISREIQPRLFEYVGGILRNHRCWSCD
jgi:hypothetical protein